MPSWRQRARSPLNMSDVNSITVTPASVGSCSDALGHGEAVEIRHARVEEHQAERATRRPAPARARRARTARRRRSSPSTPHEVSIASRSRRLVALSSTARTGSPRRASSGAATCLGTGP